MNNNLFARIARAIANAMAHPGAFATALLLVVLWAAWGPSVNYSENWQLVINTSTTILTFLMVFLLQNTQNRDSRAMHIKLDELIRAVHGARTEMVDLENVTEEELTKYCNEFKNLHLHYARVLSKRGHNLELAVEDAEIESDAPAAAQARAKSKTRAKQAKASPVVVKAAATKRN
jgi:low affinity Fe/Cu permease